MHSNPYSALALVSEVHSGHVAFLATSLARALSVSEWDLARLSLAALLHDVGKVYVPTCILGKPGPLTPEEWALIKQHPARGEQTLRGIGITDSYVLASVRHHHERIDGQGYPDGLRGGQIPLGARIIAIADAWEAMTSTRPYQPALSLAAAKAELIRCSGHQFDSEYVHVFLNQVVAPAERAGL